MAAVVLFLASCGGGAGNDPKATLIAFMDALSKKDFAAAKKLATKDSESMFGMMEMAMKMGGDKAAQDLDKFDKTKMEFGEPKIEGDKATISVKEKGKEETVNFPLKKEDGSWKVAFDKSMMTSNMDKIQDKMSEGTDEMKEGMEKLKNIDADTLKKAMSEGMKALDTVANALDKLKQ